jgi:hypothetical protein
MVISLLYAPTVMAFHAWPGLCMGLIKFAPGYPACISERSTLPALIKNNRFVLSSAPEMIV